MPLLTKLAAAAGIACAIAVAVPAAASAAPAGAAAPGTISVGCTQQDFFQLWDGDIGKCYANNGVAFPNFPTQVVVSGNNCGEVYYTRQDGSHGQLAVTYWQTYGLGTTVTVNQIDLGCLG